MNQDTDSSNDAWYTMVRRSSNTSLFQRIHESPDEIHSVHYACSSIYEPEVPIYCIAFVDFEPERAHTYSRQDYSELELFRNANAFLTDHADCSFVGWNNLTPRFGFTALRRRFRRLDSSEALAVPSDTYDIDSVLGDEYGDGYAPNPKLWFLGVMNELRMADFLPGPQEARLGDDEAFFLVENSTLRKARLIAKYAKLAARGRLVVQEEGEEETDEEFWTMQHRLVVDLARPRYASGHYADAVEAVMKEINDIVKRHYKKLSGEEWDGRDLMFQAFNENEPHIRLADPETESGQSIQEGYSHIFAGAMQAIRNPKAHANLDIEPERARLLLSLGSLLFSKLAEAEVLPSG